jgi:DNA-binding response OmpR family regulator
MPPGYVLGPRSRSAKPGAKIIAISGNARFGNVDFLKIARRLDATDAVAKPFDPDELLSRVKACLTRAADAATPSLMTACARSRPRARATR